MQVRVVTSEPWDVKADVLAIPVLGDPAFEGPQAELDRRSGGELKALAAFGELSGKRYSTALAASGDLPAGRLLVVGAGEADKLDREAVVRIASSVERRLGGRKVGSLAYCAAEVEAAADRWRRALALGEEEGVSAESALRGFADALDGARDLGPRSAPVARDLAVELRARAEEGAVRELEPWLVERETSLRAALEDDMGRAAVDAIGEAVDRDLAPYRDRMPARVLDQVRMESLTRRVLEAHGLPRLSLFHL